MIQCAISKNTQLVYQRGFQAFKEFLSSCGQAGPPANTNQVTMFVGHMSLAGYAPSTIETYVSAIKYYHKINGWPDPTNAFIMTKLLEGSRRQNGRRDTRHPLTLDLIERILPILPIICYSGYEALLFQTSLLISFHGFMRVSEFTVDKSELGRCIQFEGVSLGCKQSHTRVQIVIPYSKTDQMGHSQTVTIMPTSDRSYCPVSLLGQFLKVRPNRAGPLFIHKDGSYLTKHQFTVILKKGIKLIGMDQGSWGTHCIRIGATTFYSSQGATPDQLRKWGRWGDKSTVFQRYIHTKSVSGQGREVNLKYEQKVGSGGK